MPAWEIYEISTYPLTYGMFYMYEAIIITKILMHFCSQKGINAIMLYYFFPPLWKRFMY